MPDSIVRALEVALTGPVCIGQILIRKTNDDMSLTHRDDAERNDLEEFSLAEDAVEIACYDDAGNYRPLKTAPTLRHGWRLTAANLNQVRCALDYFYPGRLAVLAAWNEQRLTPTPLRETLDRQSGMYRAASKISDFQIEDVIGNFCRSDSGCLRTILWKRDPSSAIASTKLPAPKYDPSHDQTGRGEKTIPLLCQEACNLLVAECRRVVKGE